MEFATGQSVVLDLSGEIEHVKYAQADLILVAPATANVISKFAYKISDNPINSLLITAHGYDTPILFVPSMHASMYKSISENIDKIKSEVAEGQVNFLKPRIDEGKAKFPKIDDIILNSKRIINTSQSMETPRNLDNKKILISLGGTYEAFDPIRGITNKSSGKMGLELAKEAYNLGLDVKLIVGNVNIEIPKSFDVISVESTEEMNNITKKIINDFDIFIATAAVSDFAPINKESSKISSSMGLSLEFKATEKIIKQIKQVNPDIFLIGFKAEYNISKDEMINLAKKQIEEVGTDLVIANDVSIKNSGFESDYNQVILVDDEIVEVPRTTKSEIARIIFDKLEKEL
jgi:phosphopantothenoylcysteine decarboxylase/phosphopantothenate--cysteine ligase